MQYGIVLCEFNELPTDRTRARDSRENKIKWASSSVFIELFLFDISNTREDKDDADHHPISVPAGCDMSIDCELFRTLRTDCLLYVCAAVPLDA